VALNQGPGGKLLVARTPNRRPGLLMLCCEARATAHGVGLGCGFGRDCSAYCKESKGPKELPQP